MTPEATVAQAVLDVINSTTFEVGTVSGERVHHVPLAAEEYQQRRILVWAQTVEEQLADRSGAVSREITVSVLVGQQRGRTNTTGLDCIASLAHEIDKAIRGRLGEHIWTGSQRELFQPEWLESGIAATVVTATYRRVRA